MPSLRVARWAAEQAMAERAPEGVAVGAGVEAGDEATAWAVEAW
jgi:hypothetical protein